MKQYDKNSLIGLLLIGVILIIFNTFFFPSINEVEQEEPLTNNDITKSTDNLTYDDPNSEQVIINTDSTINEELKLQYGIFAISATGEDKNKVLENDKIKVTISTKGGKITSVILKEYETYNSLPLELFNAESSEFTLY